MLELLGSGSYGKVYSARDCRTGEVVAAKALAAEADSPEVMHEVNVLRSCNHANVVGYFGCIPSADALWILMEHCGGGSVRDAIVATGKPLNEEQIRVVVRESLQGIAYLHDVHRVHRDIKCSNILLTSSGDVKLADFGVAAQLTRTMTKCKTFIGTPHWMSPEQIEQSRYDGKADVWALGISALEMAHTDPPHADVHPMRVIFLITKSDPPRLHEPDSWSSDFVNFIECALQKVPANRPTSTALLAHDFVENAPVSSECIRPLVHATFFRTSTSKKPQQNSQQTQRGNEPSSKRREDEQQPLDQGDGAGEELAGATVKHSRRSAGDRLLRVWETAKQATIGSASRRFVEHGKESWTHTATEEDDNCTVLNHGEGDAQTSTGHDHVSVADDTYGTLDGTVIEETGSLVLHNSMQLAGNGDREGEEYTDGTMIAKKSEDDADVSEEKREPGGTSIDGTMITVEDEEEAGNTDGDNVEGCDHCDGTVVSPHEQNDNESEREHASGSGSKFSKQVLEAFKNAGQQAQQQPGMHNQHRHLHHKQAWVTANEVFASDEHEGITVVQNDIYNHDRTNQTVSQGDTAAQKHRGGSHGVSLSGSAKEFSFTEHGKPGAATPAAQQRTPLIPDQLYDGLLARHAVAAEHFCRARDIDADSLLNKRDGSIDGVRRALAEAEMDNAREAAGSSLVGDSIAWNLARALAFWKDDVYESSLSMSKLDKQMGIASRLTDTIAERLSAADKANLRRKSTPMGDSNTVCHSMDSANSGLDDRGSNG